MFNPVVSLKQIFNPDSNIPTSLLPKKEENILSTSLPESQQQSILLTQNLLSLENEKIFFIEDIIYAVQFTGNNKCSPDAFLSYVSKK